MIIQHIFKRHEELQINPNQSMFQLHHQGQTPIVRETKAEAVEVQGVQAVEAGLPVIQVDRIAIVPKVDLKSNPRMYNPMV